MVRNRFHAKLFRPFTYSFAFLLFFCSLVGIQVYSIFGLEVNGRLVWYWGAVVLQEWLVPKGMWASQGMLQLLSNVSRRDRAILLASLYD